MPEALVFAVAPSEAGRPSHPHLGSSNTLQAVSAGIRSAREKLLTACSVNTRAVKACRFPFPQSCKMSVHNIAPNAFPLREGTEKRQPDALPAGAALASSVHSKMRQQSESKAAGEQ